MFSKTSLARLAGAAAATLLCSQALAQQEWLQFPCDARVSGTALAYANVYTSAGWFGDADREWIGGIFSPGILDPFTFSNSGTARAAVSREFLDNGCPTQVDSGVANDMGYAFLGDLYEMNFSTRSLQEHLSRIARGPFSMGPGDNVTAETIATMPHSDNLNASIPFVVAGGNGAAMVVTDFYLARTDSGPSSGYTYLYWEIIEDLDGNCAAGWDEPILSSGFISVGPNERYEAPDERFAIPRGYYILRVYHRPSSYLSVTSPNCQNAARGASNVSNEGNVRFELH